MNEEDHINYSQGKDFRTTFEGHGKTQAQGE